MDAVEARDVLLDVSLPARLAHRPSYWQHHPVSSKDVPRHCEGDCRKWFVRLLSFSVLVVATAVSRLPRVEQQSLVLWADDPVGEGGTTGKVVDANPEQKSEQSS